MSFAVTAVVVGAGASYGLSQLNKPPKAAKFQDVSLQDQQGLAIAGNTAAFKPASKLAGLTNTFNAEEIRRMNELSMPGYAAMQAKGTANIMDWMSGKVPTDVSNAVRTNAAQRSVSGGFGGTGMGRNLEARDLGMTSLDVMSKGMDSASRWMQMNQSQARPFDVTSMFVSPNKTADFAVEQRNQKLSYTNSANAYDYQNSPNTKFLNQMEGLVGQLVSGGINKFLGSGKSGGSGNSGETPYTDSLGGGRGYNGGQ